MTSVSTLSPTQYRYLYGANGEFTGQQTLVDVAQSILTQQNQATEQSSSSSSSSSDGADDGKISLGSKIGSFFKGIGKTIVNAVKSLNPLNPKNWGNILKTAGCIALCCIPYAGPVIAVGMAGIGIAKGVVAVGKGVSAASNAKTDAEAEAAWENIGSGTFQVAASAVAAKCGIKAIKANGGLTASLSKGASWAKATAGKAKAWGAQKLENVNTSNIKDLTTSAKESVSNSRLVENAKSVYHNAKEQGIKEYTLGKLNKVKSYGSEKFGSPSKIYDAAKQYGSKAYKTAKTYANKAYKGAKSVGNKWLTAEKAAGYTKFASATPAIANLLEQANSDDDMVRYQAIAQLQELGYYNVY